MSSNALDSLQAGDEAMAGMSASQRRLVQQRRDARKQQHAAPSPIHSSPSMKRVKHRRSKRRLKQSPSLVLSPVVKPGWDSDVRRDGEQYALPEAEEVGWVHARRQQWCRAFCHMTASAPLVIRSKHARLSVNPATSWRPSTPSSTS